MKILGSEYLANYTKSGNLYLKISESEYLIFNIFKIALLIFY